MTPLIPTVTKREPDQTISARSWEVPERWEVQVIPLGEVRIVPLHHKKTVEAEVPTERKRYTQKEKDARPKQEEGI